MIINSAFASNLSAARKAGAQGDRVERGPGKLQDGRGRFRLVALRPAVEVEARLRPDHAARLRSKRTEVGFV